MERIEDQHDPADGVFGGLSSSANLNGIAQLEVFAAEANQACSEIQIAEGI
jgi:hypothetical protein